MRVLISLKFPFFYDRVLNVFRGLMRALCFNSRRGKRRSRSFLEYRPPSEMVRVESKPTVCLFAIHWFAPSGAEYYALECARIAKEVGYEIIWLVDYPSDHNQWESQFLEVSSHVVPVWNDVCPFLYIDDKVGLASECVVLIHIHHSYYAYYNLSFLKKCFPQAKVVDSTHIVELVGGGFPALSLEMGDDIDVHNTVSQGLSEHFLRNGLPRSSIYRAAILPDVPRISKKKNCGVFAIGVIGRLSQQKRPYLIPRFLKELDGMLKKSPLSIDVVFYIFGYGPYAERLASISNFACIDVRLEEHCYDKGHIYGHLNCVLQLSENEGVSLVSYEAASFGVPFVATDVGQQSEMVHPDLLLPKEANLAVLKAAQIVHDMMMDQSRFSHVVQWQYERLDMLKEKYHYKRRMRQLYRRLLG